MKIYHTETQEDYDAFRDYIEHQGLEVMSSETKNLTYENRCNTKYFGIFKQVCSCDLSWFEEYFPEVTIEEFKANSEINGTVYKHDNDPVNNPPHYTQGELEVIDILQDKLTPEEFEGFLKGNVLKYTFREGIKNGTEDMKKGG